MDESILEHGKHSRGQRIQVTDALASTSGQQPGHSGSLNADAIYFIALLPSHFEGIDRFIEVVRLAIGEDEDYLPLFRQGVHLLHDPPQGLRQRCTAFAVNAELFMEIFLVLENGRYALP